MVARERVGIRRRKNCCTEERKTGLYCKRTEDKGSEIRIHIRKSQIFITKTFMLGKIIDLTLELFQETELSSVYQEQEDGFLLRLEWI